MNQDTVEQDVTAVEDALMPFILANEITQLFADAGHPQPASWQQLAGGLKEEALTSRDVNIQRFLINRHWVQILTNLSMEEVSKTRNARGCLMNGECSLPDYMRLFKGVVVPCVMSLNLLPTV